MNHDPTQYQYQADREMIEKLEAQRQRHSDLQRRRIMIDSRIEQMSQSLREVQERARSMCGTANVQEISQQVNRIRDENQSAIQTYEQQLNEYEKNVTALEALFD